MTWLTNESPASDLAFAIVPLRTFIEWDCLPLIFSFDTADGLRLAIWNDETEAHFRYLIVPTTQAVVDRMERNEITVREAIESDDALVVDVDWGLDPCRPVHGWRVKTSEIPESELPVAGVYLRRDGECEKEHQ